MTVEQMRAMIAQQRAYGLDRIMFVVDRVRPPRGRQVRINGLGMGEIANAQQKNGRWQIASWFMIADCEKYLAKHYPEVV